MLIVQTTWQRKLSLKEKTNLLLRQNSCLNTLILNGPPSGGLFFVQKFILSVDNHPMKLILFTLILSLNLHAKECVIDTSHKEVKDCVQCGGSLPAVSTKSEGLMSGLVDFATDKKDQVKLVDRFKAYQEFLSAPNAKSQCSNYKALVGTFQQEFQKEVGECEKGPAKFERNRILCEYVLSTYSRKITDTFHSYWSKPGPNGVPVAIPGRYPEQLEGPIRAHMNWCNKVRSVYKGTRAFISCNDMEDLVGRFDAAKNVSESMRRDREAQERSVSTAKSREQLFEEGCKYFDDHAANTFLKDLYLKCVTR
jgi:hypothetical protein